MTDTKKEIEEIMSSRPEMVQSIIREVIKLEKDKLDLEKPRINSEIVEIIKREIKETSNED